MRYLRQFPAFSHPGTGVSASPGRRRVRTGVKFATSTLSPSPPKFPRMTSRDGAAVPESRSSLSLSGSTTRESAGSSIPASSNESASPFGNSTDIFPDSGASEKLQTASG